MQENKKKELKMKKGKLFKTKEKEDKGIHAYLISHSTRVYGLTVYTELIKVFFQIQEMKS